MRQLGRFAPVVLAISLAIAPALAADDSNEAWKALVEGGHVALIRHGNAPGPSLGAGGDPPGFRIGDCRTQRNLDETGRGRQRPSARPSAATACAWTGSSPRPGAAAWKRPS